MEMIERMSEQVQIEKEKKKQKQQLTKPTQITEQELDTLASQIKAVETEWKLDTFKRYRECGQLILDSGYKKGRWNDQIKTHFLAKLNYGERTFRYMVQLGSMSEEEFGNAIAEFKSFYEWACKPKQIKEAKLTQYPIPEGFFNTEAEAEAFYQKYGGYLLSPSKAVFYIGMLLDTHIADAKKELKR